MVSERELVLAEMLVEVFEELDERVLVVRPRLHVKDQPSVGAIGGKADSS
jgi:hypothetical protein